MKSLILFLSLYFYSLANSHIFVYHRFDDPKHASTNTSKEELIKQFEYFKKNNYEVVSLEKILAKVSKKEKIPANWVALTIDDSYKSFYDNGLEIFKKYGYHFTIFVYVEATQKKYKDFVSWEQLKEINKYGDLGLHSYGHDHLMDLTTSEIKEDTAKALKLFEQNLGFTPTSYVYPYGEYDDRVEEIIKSFGFKSVLNQSVGSVTKDSNIYDINRIALVGKVNINHKLRYKTLPLEWIEPKAYPKDGVLKQIKAKVNPKIKTLKMYVTGHGWKDIKVKNGLVDETVNLKLKRTRSRVILGTSVFTISTKTIIKGK